MFARYLCSCIGLEVLQRRASDLLSPWVGGTERKIAAAFSEAAADGAILLFDEVDSLLGARTGSGPRWEVSQVNEMLTWMECHPLPFICTTNFAEALDAAALRRFTFKISFGFLNPKQVAYAFQHFFGRECPRAIEALSTLTVSDFATVLNRATILGLDTVSSHVEQMLIEEAEGKPGFTRIGFRLG